MSISLRVLSAAALLCLTTGPSRAATPTPGPTSRPGIAFEAVTSPGAGMPFDLAAADLNGDGHVDLVSSNPSKDHIAVHLGDGAGHFAAPTVRRSGRFPRGVALAVQQPGAAIARAVRVDAAGNATIAGAWTPPTNGTVLWAYGDPPGDSQETGRAVALDGAGRAFVAGETASDWLVVALDPQGRPLWRMVYDGGGAPINRDQATAIAVAPPADLFIAGVVHPLPAQLPSLGKVQWRLARYKMP